MKKSEFLRNSIRKLEKRSKDLVLLVVQELIAQSMVKMSFLVGHPGSLKVSLRIRTRHVYHLLMIGNQDLHARQGEKTEIGVEIHLPTMLVEIGIEMEEETIEVETEEVIEFRRHLLTGEVMSTEEIVEAEIL